MKPLPPTTTLVLRNLSADDLARVTEWHLRHFPHSFYAHLGSGFIAHYYRGYLAVPDAAALAAVDVESGDLVGYLVGTTNDGQYRRRHTRTSLVLAVHGAAALAVRPQLWPDFVQRRAGWYARRAARAALRTARPTPVRERFGELLYVITDPRHRGRGVGSALVARYVTEARAANAARLHLVTDANNPTSLSFYEHRGWKFESERSTRDGRLLTALHLPMEVRNP